MTDQLLTARQVAERLNLRPRTVLQYLRPGGKLNHLRIPITTRTVRVKESALQEYIDSHAS